MILRGSDTVLFHGGELMTRLGQHDANTKQAVDELSELQVLEGDVAELSAKLAEHYSLAVPRLRRLEASLEHRDEKFDARADPRRIVVNPSQPSPISGTVFVVHVPFDGDAEFFKLKPSTFTHSPPYATVRVNELVLTFHTADPDAAKIKAAAERELGDIEQWLGWIRQDVGERFEKLASRFDHLLRTRRAKLDKDRKTAEATGFALRRRDDAPESYRVPLSRKRLVLPPLPAFASPHPVLDAQQFEDILAVLHSMALVMERSPRAFSRMDEEDIRTHFLLFLNGLYQGQAMGETFNSTGKTDILLRVGDRNIMIAECKFWEGPQTLLDAVEQAVVKYASWRDAKAVVLLFSRGKQTTRVIDRVPEVVARHGHFKIHVGKRGETRHDFAMRHGADTDRTIHLSVLVFDVPGVT